MELKELSKVLAENQQRYLFEETEWKGIKGLLVEDRILQTKVFLPCKVIEESNLQTLLLAINQGRNVEHITRVTGYFSKVSGWNKGKVAELIDRYRTTVS